MPHYCMNCEAAEMVLETRDVTVNYKNLSTVVPAVAGWHCPACGEIEFTDEARPHAHMQALQDLVALHKEQTKTFIKSTRKKLNLTQAAASRIFGGGVNAFSEYERGVTQPHPSTLKLLHLLNKHPEMLDEVSNA